MSYHTDPTKESVPFLPTAPLGSDRPLLGLPGAFSYLRKGMAAKWAFECSVRRKGLFFPPPPGARVCSIEQAQGRMYGQKGRHCGQVNE